jgi:hypothetical protein
MWIDGEKIRKLRVILYCNTKMIMSYYTNLEMSYTRVVIIPMLGGGYYDRKGHSCDESRGIKAVTRYAQGNG